MHALHLPLCLIRITFCIPWPPPCWKMKTWGQEKKGGSSDRWWLMTHMQCSGCVLCKCKKGGTEKGQIVDTLHCGLSFTVSFVLREHRSGSEKNGGPHTDGGGVQACNALAMYQAMCMHLELRKVRQFMLYTCLCV